MKTTSIFATSETDLNTKILTYKKEGNNPTVAIAFFDSDYPIDLSLPVFEINGIEVIGSSTFAEICKDEVLEKGISVLLLELPKDAYKICQIDGSGSDYSKFSANLAKQAKDFCNNPGLLIYSGGVGVNGDSITNGLNEVLGNNTPIYGGMASDRFIYEKIKIIAPNQVQKEGIVALIIDNDRFELNGGSYSGWNDLGKVHKITRSKNNTVFEIDGKPALDVFQTYFTGIDYKLQEGSKDLYTIPGILPLKILRENGTDVLRSSLLYDFENKALILAGEIKQGEDFKFCPTPNLGVVNATIESLNQLKEKIAEPDAVIMNSCAGRYFAFGPMFEDEVEGIYNIWDKPTIGMLAYGEIGNPNLDSKTSFHNVTCSLVTITEK